MHLAATLVTAVFVTVQAASLQQEGNDVFASVENGNLRGVVAKSINGTLFRKFLGIPYAAPPVGELRFRAPKPAGNWSGLRDAVSYGSVCPQSLSGSEDCLTLNVFVPSSNASEPLPVMVYIHGGGFVSGSGTSQNPDYFMDKEVLLVTINYRLGSLGFLSLLNDDIPGNAGLKDQIFALQWVQRNIAAFGGDPDRVTIFGESAGGCSTSHLHLSPAAKGLFTATIVESGDATATWGIAHNPREKAYRLAAALGFTENDTNDTDVDARLSAFLRAANYINLTADYKIALSELELRTPLPLAFLPIVEPQSGSAVITEPPAEILRKGTYNHVPVMTGVTSGEGLVTILFWSSPNLPADMNENFTDIIGPLLPLPTLEERITAAKKLEHFYFGEDGFLLNNTRGFCDFLSDLYFVQPAVLFADGLVNTSSDPVYFYYFNYNGTGSLACGMGHAAETSYLFAHKIFGPDKDPNSNDGKVLNRIITLWTNFAKYSEPTPGERPVTWQKFKLNSTDYLEMNLEFEMRQDLLKERLDVWRELHLL